jgi:hypothetical protein
MLGELLTFFTPSRTAALPSARAAILANLAQDNARPADAESKPWFDGRLLPLAQATAMTLIRRQGGVGKADCTF